jgi:hypothetical protein
VGVGRVVGLVFPGGQMGSFIVYRKYTMKRGRVSRKFCAVGSRRMV